MCSVTDLFVYIYIYVSTCRTNSSRRRNCKLQFLRVCINIIWRMLSKEKQEWEKSKNSYKLHNRTVEKAQEKTPKK